MCQQKKEKRNFIFTIAKFCYTIVSRKNNNLKELVLKMKTITFLNNKGGVGKTASATTVAHMMATHFNKRTLLIDLDSQMNSTTMFSEVDFLSLFNALANNEQNKVEKSVEDLLLNRVQDIHECIKQTAYKNLDIIPSHLTLSQAEEIMKADVVTPQQFKLVNYLKQVEDEYDYCIIDSSPSVSIININGLVASDEVYIPLRCDGGSLLGVAIIMKLFKSISNYSSKLKMGGMFFTQWNGRKNVSKTVYNLLCENFGEYVLPHTIATSKNIEESSLAQIPLLEYDSGKNKSKATLDYLALTEYILNK